MTRTIGISLLVIALPGVSSGATKGIIDSFPGIATNGWGGGTPVSNPGSGGIGGAADGYLLLELDPAFPGNFGTQNTGAAYAGDWIAAGITQVTFYLNDVRTPEPFEFHLLLTGGPFGATTWEYNIGFSPPNRRWQRYAVDVASAANWTQTKGTASFADVLHAFTKVHFRHDLAPYLSSPDPIGGNLGIDQITLGPVCHSPSQDVDGDADVDLSDFSTFAGCFNGPNQPWPAGADPVPCLCLDQDGDADVDLADFSAFASCFNGPNQPPACP